VYLNPDGRGQALIYPYYTTRSVDGNAFNTYLSIVNHSQDDKAVRLRLRESRNGRETLSLNVFLGRNDVWTAALVPSTTGARLITRDQSCTEPALSLQQDGATGIALSGASYAGGNDDGAGTDIDRVREGYVDVIEMATVVGGPGQLMQHTAAGAPLNCAAVRAMKVSDSASPTGGLSGSVTLINVNNGSDFSVAAEALAELATRPFYRMSSDSYPGFAASEVDPVSAVISGGVLFRDNWSTGLDAVSAALMRVEVSAEYVLDDITRSRTDVVLTLPTRNAYSTNTSFSAPFTRAGLWRPSCAVSQGSPDAGTGELVEIWYGDRGQRGAVLGAGFPSSGASRICGAASVVTIAKAESNPLSVVGSQTGGFSIGAVPVATFMQNGWLSFRPVTQSGASTSMTSLPSSSRMRVDSGAVTVGPNTHHGLPFLGLMLRTLENGTLLCGSGACQGNYGSAFSVSARRAVSWPGM
jgi:hypothetical protein